MPHPNPPNSNPFAPAPAGPVDPQEEADEAEEGEVEVEEVDVNGKRTRKTRKTTFWIFAERIDAKTSFCKCGCFETGRRVGRLKYATSSTGNISRHVETLHPELFSAFQNAKDNRGNWTTLLEEIDRLNGDSVQQLAKQRRHSDSFWAKAVDLEPAVASDLRLLLWAISNSISRNSLNDPLFDAFLKSLGSNPSPNRHTLQSQYLPVLDGFVIDSFSDDLEGILSVALSSDGWRDRARRDWINIVLAFIVNAKNGKKWLIRVIEPDLIFLPSSATAETIAYLINNALEPLVRLPCLLVDLSHFFFFSFRRIA